MKRLAILSTPRSGTQFLSESLRKLGVMVGHERMGDDGIVCGFWAWAKELDGVMPCAAKRERRFDPDTEFMHTFHLYRDPLKCLKTMPHVIKTREIYGMWMKRLGLWSGDYDTKMVALHYWVITHEKLAALPLPRINIEKIQEQWPLIAEPLGLGPLPAGVRKATLDLGKQPTWRDLDSMNMNLSTRARVVWELLEGNEHG